MGFKEVQSLDCDNAIQLGGSNRKTGKANPSRLEGYFLGSREVASTKSKTGFSKLHIFQTTNGKEGVWGKTDLDRKLAGVALGSMTRVTFTGTTKTKNNDMYVYKVEVDADNSIEVSAPQDEAASQQAASDDETRGYDGQDEDYDEDTDPGEEDPQPDEVPASRAKPPKQAAQAPSAERQAKVKALLSGRRNV